MNKNIKIFGIIALSLLFLSGCNSFLDEVPDNRTELDTSEKISQLLTSAYPKANWAAVANPMGDGIIARTGASSNVINEDAFFWRDTRETGTDSPESFWDNCYTAIAAANHALDAIEKMTTNSEQRLFQRSEALLCRAFSHFLLVNLFAKTYVPGESNNSPGIPYVDKPETTVMPQYDRQTVAYVYQRIQEDIEEALKTIAPESNFKVPAYHFTEKAALTFASRFFLYKGDYNRVIELTSRLVPKPSLFTSNGNVDATDLANVWAATYFAQFKNWTTTSANIQTYFRAASGKHNFLIGETYSLLNRGFNYQYGTQNDEYLPSSSRRNISGGYWPYSVYGWQSTGAWYVAKFSEYFYYTTATTGYAIVIFPFIRAEEALLNRIEAEILLDMSADAINDLNIYYRQRSGSSSTITSAYDENTMVLTQTKITSYWNSTLTTPNFYLNEYNPFGAASWSDDKKALILTLLDTKKAEFIHEGARWFDILRYKMPVYHTDATGAMNTLLPNDLRRVWQIPETAKLAGLTPNPR